MLAFFHRCVGQAAHVKTDALRYVHLYGNRSGIHPMHCAPKSFCYHFLKYKKQITKYFGCCTLSLGKGKGEGLFEPDKNWPNLHTILKNKNAAVVTKDIRRKKAGRLISTIKIQVTAHRLLFQRLSR